MLNRDQILTAPDPDLKTVHVKEWGGSVCLRVMSGTERDAWETSAFTDGSVNKENFRATLLVKTLCDENRNPLFTDADIPALSAKASPAPVRLARLAMKLNGLSGEDVDELVKNS